MSSTEEYFASLYGEEFNGLVWVGGFTPNKGGARGGVFVDTAARAAEAALTLDRNSGQGLSGVYHSSGVFDPARIRARQNTVAGTRGTEADVSRVVGVFLDLDTQIGAHKTEHKLPATLEEGMALIRKVMPEPTMITFSGGGYYPIWRFEEPIEIEAGETRSVKDPYRALCLRIIGEFEAAGLHLDSTFDLARVYRVPGTMNRKAEPVMCTLESAGGGTVNRSILAAAPSAPAPEELPYVTSSQVNVYGETAGAPSPWTQDQAETALARQMKTISEADQQINSRFGGAARYIGKFVPEFFPMEYALEQLLSAARENTTHDDAWNDANGLLWTAESVITAGMRRGMGEPYTRKIEHIITEEAPKPEATPDDVDALIARMITAEALMQKPPPEPLVWGMLDRDSLAALVGLPGSFKSFIALDLAAHIGAGKPWRGKRVHQGLCIVIAAEGARGMTMRARAWVQRNGEMSNVLFLPEPVQVLDPRAWDTLVKACARLKPVFVVVDTQSMVTIGMKENDNTEMNVAMDAFRRIQRASQACVMAIHHTTKTGETTRGGGAQDGAHDTRIKLEREEPRSSLTVKMKDEKQKDMAESDESERVAMTVVDLGEDPITGRPLSSLVVDNAFGTAAREGGTEREREIDAEPWRGVMPSEWTGKVVAVNAKVKRRILQVLFDHAGMQGLTQAEARKVVADRWERPSDTGWADAWSVVVGLEPLVIQGATKSRYTVDQLEVPGL
jgi:hypothetical protein